MEYISNHQDVERSYFEKRGIAQEIYDSICHSLRTLEALPNVASQRSSIAELEDELQIAARDLSYFDEKQHLARIA